MLFNDQIKKHWLDEIERLGDRFNPDCGNSPPLGLQYKEDFGDAAPLCLLTGLYNDDCLWEAYEKEFQLPRWILECIDNHMHIISPATSKADLKKVFELCPTYTDLDLLKYKFMQKICLYLLEIFLTYKHSCRKSTILKFGPTYLL